MARDNSDSRLLQCPFDSLYILVADTELVADDLREHIGAAENFGDRLNGLVTCDFVQPAKQLGDRCIGILSRQFRLPSRLRQNDVRQTRHLQSTVQQQDAACSPCNARKTRCGERITEYSAYNLFSRANPWFIQVDSDNLSGRNRLVQYSLFAFVIPSISWRFKFCQC